MQMGKYNGFNFSATRGIAAASRLQLSGFALYVEVVTCFTPILARVAINRSGLSFTKGIMGSTRTDTGMPLLVSVSTVFRQLNGYFQAEIDRWTSRFMGLVMRRPCSRISCPDYAKHLGP